MQTQTSAHAHASVCLLLQNHKMRCGIHFRTFKHLDTHINCIGNAIYIVNSRNRFLLEPECGNCLFLCN